MDKIWLEARDLVMECVPLLPQKGLAGDLRISLGGYMFETRHGFVSFFFECKEKGVYTVVSFAPCTERTSEFFDGLIIREADNDFSRSLELRGISSVKKDSTTYPFYEYRWSNGNREKDRKGKLDFLRIDLAADTFINYYYTVALDDFNIYTKGRPGLLVKAPLDLKQETSVLGTAIPWTIDYDLVAEEILARSEIKGFLEACRKKAQG